MHVASCSLLLSFNSAALFRDFVAVLGLAVDYGLSTAGIDCDGEAVVAVVDYSDRLLSCCRPSLFVYSCVAGLPRSLLIGAAD